MRFMGFRMGTHRRGENPRPQMAAFGAAAQQDVSPTTHFWFSFVGI